MKKRLSILTLMLLVVASISTWALQSKLFATQGDEGEGEQTKTYYEATKDWADDAYPKAFVDAVNAQVAEEAGIDVAYVFDAFNKGNNVDGMSDWDIAMNFLDNNGSNLNDNQQARLKDMLSQVGNNFFYNADFVVSFDKAIEANKVQLAGQYSSFSENWVLIDLDGMAAGEELRLLNSGALGLFTGHFSYAAICGYVKEFKCGAKAKDKQALEALAGTTMTVQLRLYEKVLPEDADYNNIDLTNHKKLYGEGEDPDETGKYWVIGEYKYTFPECKIGDKMYATLAQAVNEVKDGETITLLEGITELPAFAVGKGSKKFTIDLNDNTVQFVNPAVGSTGTKNQCIHLDQGNTITIKNGSLAVKDGEDANFKFVIQNYSNLTLDNVNVDGTHLGKLTSGNYVLSCNYGTTELKGTTSLTAKTGDVALDIYDYTSSGYDSAPTITWNSTGSVTGPVYLEGGTFVLAQNFKAKNQIIAVPTEAGIVSTLELGTSKIIAADGFSNPKGAVVLVRNGAELNILSEADGGIDANNAAYSPLGVTKSGDDDTKVAKLTIENGTYSGGNYYAIVGNGGRQNTDITIKAGTFDSPGFCIYHPQRGNLTINGGTFNGYSCVGIKSGKLDIIGGTFNATGAQKVYKPNGSGIEETGQAIIIDNCNYPGGIPEVSITGGSFTSQNNTPVGSYASDEGKDPIKHFISGGTFNKEPDAKLIAEGFVAVKGTDNFWTVERSPECKIGDKMYATLAKAVEEVKDGETIELLSDVVLGKGTIEIKKNNVTLEGHDYTIALDEEDADLQIYGENGTSKKYGSYHMITVIGNNVTLQNMTLDSKDYRGASLATTTGGSNVTYKNITYKGKGSGHYYGNATGGGNLTFEGCTFNTCGYAIHTADNACNLIVKDCVINGWTSYGSAILSASFTNTTFGPSYDSHIYNICALSIYTNTIFTNCKFEETFTKHGQGDEYYYVGMFTSEPCLIQANGCSMIDKDGKVIKDADLADIADTSEDNWANGAVFAVEPQGNAENGYTAGTFVALGINDIKPAEGYKVKAVEGKDNVYTVSAPAEEVEIPEEKKDEIYSGETKLEGEQKEQAQQQIQQMAENENIAEVMADKVDEETGEVVKVNNPEEVIENGQSTDAMTVKVEFESAKVEVDEKLTIKEVAYDVTPKLVTTNEEGKTTERKIENNEIKSPIMFALPVDDIPEIGVEQEKHAKYQFAKVYHWREVEGKETVKEYLGTKPITFDNVKGNYILISSLEFSIFSYELTDKDATLLYVSNENKIGETVTEQEFFENIQPNHPNALAFVGSDKEQFARNNTNVVYATKVQEVQNLDDLSDDLICPNLVLTDISTIQAGDRETVNTDFYTPKAFTATKLTYTREGTKGLNSVYLPFAFAASDIDSDHASNIKIGVFEKVVKRYADLEYDFAVFNVVESLNPDISGVACLIKDVRNLPDEEDYVWNIQKANVEILTNDDWNQYQVSHKDVPCLDGSLVTINSLEQSGCNIWKIDDSGEFFGTANNGICFPFRSYLVTSKDSGTKLRIAWSDEATGISTIETIDNAKDGIMYNLLGVKVGNDYQGVVIKNGKTMLKK